VTLTVDEKRLRSLVEALPSRVVTVIGDVMLDRYLIGDAERISAEAPAIVVRVGEERLAPGGAANVATNVAAAGADARLVGVTGTDADGRALRDQLVKLGVGSDRLLEVQDRPTTTKTRILAPRQQVCRFDREEDRPLSSGDAGQLESLAFAALEGSHALLLEDYDKGTLTSPFITHVIARARSLEIPVIVDPKYRQFFAYSGATVFKPNVRELAVALGVGVDPAHPDGLEMAWRRLGAEHLLVTMGGDGMMLVSGPGLVRRVRGHPRDVFDVSGAGDTVTAWLGLVLAAGGTIEEAAVIANAAAGVGVTKPGVATVSPAEVVEAVLGG
jgi:D-beta-D-heptose 7-phosphate kinase/D-beta-D-heptose 1-phosphate adenosyltransferase